jgi:hypothetical protein
MFHQVQNKKLTAWPALRGNLQIKELMYLGVTFLPGENQ